MREVVEMKLVFLMPLLTILGSGALSPPERMQGLWRNDFEGSQFCPAPATKCSFVPTDKRTGPVIWLDASIPFPDAIRKRPMGGLYAIEFVGRRSTHPGRYGHMGVFDERVIVDRIISISEVEAPVMPTKADVESMREQCRKMPSCSMEELEKANRYAK